MKSANPLWKFFCSVKLTIVLLLSLAATSIIGTVIPQNQNPEAYFNAYGPFPYQLLSVLGIFDMYHAWWFQGLLMLLTVNIVVCSIDRLPVTLKTVFSKRKARNPAMFRNLMRKEVFDSPLSPDDLERASEELVTGSEGVKETPEGFYIIGNRGGWTRFGVYGVHLSIVLLVVGAIIGSMFGFDGYVSIVEGESVSTVRLGNSGAVHNLGFELCCDDFDISFYPNGTPKEYRSAMTVLEGGEPTIQQDILVNAPLRHKGINIFQSHYGLLYVELTLKNNKTGAEYQREVAMEDSVELPEALGVFVLNGFQGAIAYKGENLGPAFYGHLIPVEGAAQSVLLPLEDPEWDQQRKGDVTISVSGTRYYTRLQVTRDPGVWVVYAGFIMLIIGCFVTFFTSHQRLFVEVVKEKAGCRVTVAGTANKNKFGMQQEVKRIAEKLGKKGVV